MFNRFSSGFLYTAAQVREIDRLAIARGTPGIVLMRRAAEAAWQEAQRRYPHVRKLVVLCGAGNNGGDGYLVARTAAASGVQVSVFAFADSRGDANEARNALLADGVEVAPHNEFDATCLDDDCLVVDALLGTGAAGAPRSAYAAAIQAVNRAAKPVLALDIPSGICADSGRLLGTEAIRADLTVTFIAWKRGLFTDAATEHTGELVLAGLGIDAAQFAPQTALQLCQLEKLLGQLPARRANHYKNRSGHVLVVGGDYGMAGATVLAGRAAFAAGAGLVSVATRPEHVAAVVAAQPELMVHGVDKPAKLEGLLARASVVAIGPGLGRSSWSRQLLQQVGQCNKPLVVDADALNIIAGQPALLPAAAAVMTPHPGEARRLAIAQGIDPALDRFALCGELQKAYGKVVILKGAGTIVCDPDQSAVCPYGHPVLATAGSGDVLTGIVAALLAQGVELFMAAQLSACLHALAGELLVQSRGERGMLAGDLVGALGDLLNSELCDSRSGTVSVLSGAGD